MSLFEDKINSGYYQSTKLTRYDNTQKDSKQRLLSEFYQDLKVELDIVNHPKASKLIGIAWDLSHANGLYDVYLTAYDLVQLIK